MHERYVISADTGCWVYQRSINPAGYGFYRVPGTRRNRKAHRYFYEEVYGPVPGGLELDHLCRNTRCVNPDHLEPVTHVENRRRARRANCLRGHPLSGPNLYVSPSGERECKECTRIRQRKARNRSQRPDAKGGNP